MPMWRQSWGATFRLFLLIHLWSCSADSDGDGTMNSSPSLQGKAAACNCGTTSAANAAVQHAEHHSYEYQTLIYLFGALLLGGGVLHITMIPALKSLQTTVVIFASGVILGLVMETGVLDDVHMVKRSYDAWTEIDPHLLLYTFLPALLCGDAMTVDTHVAQRCMRQCLWLAGPGVVVGSFSTALVVCAIYGWNFWLALTVGSILAATDPVAVVTLLKDLGASPQLTILIQGESLLNDGTAIVLFTVAYDIVCGEKYSAIRVICTLCKSIFGALFIGFVVGILAYSWVYMANDKLNHHSCMVQVAVTLSCAYWSFILSEGVFHVSGVLSTVATSFVLAHKMWPVLVSAEGMLQIWHMVEMVGNTLVFFLSGSITGKTLRAVALGDYFRALAVYVIMTLIRFFMLVFSYPVLKRIGHKVAPRDILVMSWGGLRGMVGMALAILVKKDGLATGHISGEQGDRILFLVNTMAMLTLVINAPTCPALCRSLGIMRTPDGRNVLLRNVAKHAQDTVNESMNELLDNPSLSRQYAPTIMREMVAFVLDEVNHHLPGSLLTATRGSLLTSTRKSSSKNCSILSQKQSALGAPYHTDRRSADSQEDELHDAFTVVAAVTEHTIPDLPGSNCAASDQFSLQKRQTRSVSDSRGLQSLTSLHSARSNGKQSLRSARTSCKPAKRTILHETLHNVLFDHVPESPDVQILWDRFEEGRQCLLNSGAKITQFQFGKQLSLMKHMLRTEACDPEGLQIVRQVFLEVVRANYWDLLEKGWLIAGTNEPSALMHSVNLAQENTWHCLSDWNILEQELISEPSRGTCSDPESKCGTWHHWYRSLQAKKVISSQTHAVHIIEAFIEAHCRAQTEVASYFGEGHEVDSPEEAFVIIESQTEVFAAAAKRIHIDPRLAIRVSTMWEVQQLFKEYHKHIYHVVDSGVLNHKEAEILLHPLEDGMRKLHRERQRHFKALDQALGSKKNNDLDMVLDADSSGRMSQTEAAIRIQRRVRHYFMLKQAEEMGASPATIKSQTMVIAKLGGRVSMEQVRTSLTARLSNRLSHSAPFTLNAPEAHTEQEEDGCLW